MSLKMCHDHPHRDVREWKNKLKGQVRSNYYSMAVIIWKAWKCIPLLLCGFFKIREKTAEREVEIGDEGIDWGAYPIILG